jgi:hypothetical protein
LLPSAFIVKISMLSQAAEPRKLGKAIFVPSGDHVGSMSGPEL